MCGDFNSIVVFNNHHPKAKNHTELNRKLESKNLISVYQDVTDDVLGDEKSKTFYQARHLNIPSTWILCILENVVKEFNIDYYKWITVSDYLPLVFKYDFNYYKKIL